MHLKSFNGEQKSNTLRLSLILIFFTYYCYIILLTHPSLATLNGAIEKEIFRKNVF